MSDFIIPPDDQDRQLGNSGDDSLFQRVRHLSSQQRQLFDLLCQGVDPGEACAKAGYKTRGAMAILQRKIPDIMDRCGLTDEYLINSRLKPLLDAEETKFFKTSGWVPRKDLEGEKPEKQEDLEYTDLIETPPRPALGIRRDALDMAFKLRGSYARPDRSEEEAGSHDITVQIINVGAA